jgi:hypothetical protein
MVATRLIVPSFDYNNGTLVRGLRLLPDLLLFGGVATVFVLGTFFVIVEAARFVSARRARHSASRATDFVTALTVGDFEGAEAEVARLLRVNDPEQCSHRAPRNPRWSSWVPARHRSLEFPPLQLFDAHTELGCGLDEFRRLVDSPAALTQWFGAVRCSDASSIVIPSGRRTVRLHEVVERWQPELAALRTEAVTADGSALRGFVMIREAMAARQGRTGVAVQIWVHLELPADRRGRRALAALKPAIEHGLRTLEREFDAA